MASTTNDAVDRQKLEERLHAIARRDVTSLGRAEEQYGGSWKRRGGTGAFMMAARKFDRIEQAMTKVVRVNAAPLPLYDIFLRAENDKRPEGIIDDIRDLRRYLLLIEDELNQNYGFGTVGEAKR